MNTSKAVDTHALVFFDQHERMPYDSIVYKHNLNWYERKFINEFVNFGSKELIKKLDIPENELVIELNSDTLKIYITIHNQLGCALLISSDVELGNMIHIVSRKLISNYILKKEIPSEDELLKYFKTKIMKSDLEHTKNVMKRSISKVLKRGENIEELVQQTELLSNSAKTFLIKSRDINRCCWVFPRLRW